jgi:hypothetical protein
MINPIVRASANIRKKTNAPVLDKRRRRSPLVNWLSIRPPQKFGAVIKEASTNSCYIEKRFVIFASTIPSSGGPALRASTFHGVSPILLAFLLVVSGCAPTASVETNKDADFTREPKRLVIIEALGPELGKYTDSFKTTLSQGIKGCGVTTNFIYRPSAAPSADTEKEWQAKEGAFVRQFGPDTILSIAEAKYTRRTVSNQYGVVSSNIAQIIYELELFDVVAKKPVWKAQITLDTHFGLIEVGDAGAELANAVVGKLEQDKIFHTCITASAH